MSGNAFTSATSLGASSKQDYGTPRAFLDAVERCWGPITFDLAAHASNHVAPGWFGPGGIEEDSLKAQWPHTTGDNLLWLNPPFSRIVPWVRKCAEQAGPNRRIAFLVPANVGANWHWDYVVPFAHALILSPRISFEGCPEVLQNRKAVEERGEAPRYLKMPFPGSLMLALFGMGDAGKLSRWEWKKS